MRLHNQVQPLFNILRDAFRNVLIHYVKNARLLLLHP